MATRTQSRSRSAIRLEKPDLLEFYRLMLLSRRLDDKEIQLKRQQRSSSRSPAPATKRSRWRPRRCSAPGHDWFYLYYRDRALCLGLGMTATEQLLSAVAAADDPNSGGRQMPSHWGHKDLNIVNTSSPTGTQFLQAVGAAETWLRASADERTRDLSPGDEVVLCTAGEGTTSEGEFWESLNTACNLKLPIVYLIEDNGYAISVPVEVQHGRRIDLQAGAVVPQSAYSGSRRLRSARLVRRDAQGARLRPPAQGPGAGACAR